MAALVLPSQQWTCGRGGRQHVGSALADGMLSVAEDVPSAKADPTYSFRYENGIGCSSPGWRLKRLKSIDSRLRRGGVPVLRRPISKPSFTRQPERPLAAAS